jgi:hypothetical protein
MKQTLYVRRLWQLADSLSELTSALRSEADMSYLTFNVR